MKITNAIKCKKCGAVIYSRARHDFRWCPCKNIAINGGFDYQKITGSASDWLSVEPFNVDANKAILYLDFVQEKDKYGLMK